MEEYYCTKCNAILNDQPGFDPSLEIWTCTECGQVLYGDVIESTISRFPNGVWYCDSCGAVLSLQPGFNDSCEVWECTECGYMNPINEDELYESEEDYQKNKHIFRCPDCGRELNEQRGFKNTDTYTCEWCNTDLYKDGSDYKILYTCPNCGAKLNEQWLFYEDDEWECNECNSQLIKDGNRYIYNDEISYEEDDDNDEEYDDNDEEYDDNDEDNDDEYETVTIKYSSVTTTYEPSKKKGKAKRIFSLLLVLIIVVGVAYYEHSLLIPINYSNNKMVGDNYENVTDKLKEDGFLFVLTKEIADLSMQHISSEYKVTDIKISWIFSLKDRISVPSNIPIIVTYHSLKKISVPMSSKEATDYNYKDVVKAFRNAGFVDVEIVEKKDLITGWLAKDGEVDSVYIGDIKKFSSDDKFKPNEKVVITYHSFRNKR